MANEEIKTQQKQSKQKTARTPEQKKHSRKIAVIVIVCIVCALAIFFAVTAIVNNVGVKGLMEKAQSYTKVEYTAHEQITPVLEEDGYWTFSTGNDFDVMQLTDVHIGAGFMSFQKDAWAMDAVAAMIRQRQPDLVVVTGDIAYPVPFQAGTINNLKAAEIFATEMESLGVYWTFAFGNHDTEAYALYTRKQICDWYAQKHFTYCMFDGNNVLADKKAAEDFGYGNNIIKIKNGNIITQALVTFDSHSYTDGDFLGFSWKYDNIHQSQIDWYEAEMEKLRQENAANGYTGAINNLAFFHIPLREYREAWASLAKKNEEHLTTWKKSVDYDSKTNDEKELLMRQYDRTMLFDSDDVVHYYGYNGEIVGASPNPFATNAEETYGVFCGVYKAELDGKFWDAAARNDMKGTFCGHDHINNFSVGYTKNDKTIRLTYGYSIDYLAYSGIYRKHSQRGCTLITISADGSTFDCQPLNYYTDFNNIEFEAGDNSDLSN